MVIDKCKAAAEALTPVNGKSWTFYDAELYEMNENDNASSPFVFLVHPLRGKDEWTNKFFDSTIYNLELLFISQSKLEAKQSERQANVDAMLAAKDEFITNIETAGTVVNSCTHEEIYNKFDLNADGIYAVINIQINVPCVD